LGKTSYSASAITRNFRAEPNFHETMATPGKDFTDFDPRILSQLLKEFAFLFWVCRIMIHLVIQSVTCRRKWQSP
jgi:hypothetical protein